MTIRLHTGVPGSGKSLHVVDTVEFTSEFKGRPIFAHAVDGWLSAVSIRCQNLTCRTCRSLDDAQRKAMHCIEDWHVWAPSGAVIVVDEAHYPFPSRREREQPVHVQRLTEHRHDGLDFWMCTPNANLLDINVRRLVEQHRHYTKGRLGRYVYVHSEVMDSDDKLKIVKPERVSLPKRAFAKYKSADMHVTIKAGKPKILYRIPILIGLALFAIWGSVQLASDLRRSNAPAPPMVSESIPVGSGGLLSVSQNPSLHSSTSREEFWSSFSSSAFRPRVQDVPASAPIYDSAEVPVFVPPVLGGCISKSSASKRDCRCFSTDGRELSLSFSSCSSIASGGSASLAGGWAHEQAQRVRPTPSP